MKKILVLILFAFLSNTAFAYTECTFNKVDYVFLKAANGGTDDVYIRLVKPTGDFAVIYKNNNTLSQTQINRIYTAALTAFTAGKKLTVRYPEDNLDCSTLSAARNDFIGITIRD